MSEKLRAHIEEVLTAHWLHVVECDHQTKTDKAACACGWTSESEPSVGHAVRAWSKHAISFIDIDGAQKKFQDEVLDWVIGWAGPTEHDEFLTEFLHAMQKREENERDAAFEEARLAIRKRFSEREPSANAWIEASRVVHQTLRSLASRPTPNHDTVDDDWDFLFAGLTDEVIIASPRFKRLLKQELEKSLSQGQTQNKNQEKDQ